MTETENIVLPKSRVTNIKRICPSLGKRSYLRNLPFQGLTTEISTVQDVIHSTFKG